MIQVLLLGFQPRRMHPKGHSRATYSRGSKTYLRLCQHFAHKQGGSSLLRQWFPLTSWRICLFNAQWELCSFWFALLYVVSSGLIQEKAESTGCSHFDGAKLQVSFGFVIAEWSFKYVPKPADPSPLGPFPHVQPDLLLAETRSWRMGEKWT